MFNARNSIALSAGINFFVFVFLKKLPLKSLTKCKTDKFQNFLVNFEDMITRDKFLK